MKRNIFTIFMVTGLCLAAILTAACPLAFNAPGRDSIPAGKGVVHLSVAGSTPRTVFPDELSGFTYSAVFTSETQAQVIKSLPGGVASVELLPATWTIIIEARCGGNPVGRVTIPNVALAEGQELEYKNILIQPITGEGADNGNLIWSMEFPDGIDSAVLYYSKNGGTTVGPLDILSGSIKIGEKRYSDGTIELAPGSYMFRAVLKKDDRQAGKTEVVHIYPGLDSTVDWLFYTASFFNTKEVTVNVDITHSAAVEIQGVTLKPRAYIETSSYTKSGNTYTFELLGVEETAVDLEDVHLVITTAKNTVTTAVDTYGITGDVVTLDPVGIFALDITGLSGSSMKVIVDGVTIEDTADFSVDVIKTKTVRLDLALAPGYELSGIEAESNNSPFGLTEVIADEQWTFIMPADDVELTLTIDAPALNINTNASGTFVLAGDTGGKAIVGTQITVTAKPNPGYKFVNGKPVASPPVALTPVPEQDYTWTFTMPAEAISLSFPELGLREIYKGGARDGLSVGTITMGGMWDWGGSGYVTLNADVPGHNGNSRAIELAYTGEYDPVPPATRQISFSLNMSSVYNMAGMGALSFWMRTTEAGGGALNPIYGLGGVGGGGADATRVIYAGENVWQEATDVLVDTTWRRYIVPIPSPRDTTYTTTRIFFMKVNAMALLDGEGSGRKVLIDDMEFIPAGEVNISAVTIPSEYSSEIPYPTPTSAYNIAMSGTSVASVLRVTYTHDGVSATLRAANVTGQVYHLWNSLVSPSDYSFEITGDAHLDLENNVVPDILGAQFNLYLLFRGVRSNAISGKFSSGILEILENFSAAGAHGNGGNGWLSDFTNSTFRYWIVGMRPGGESWIRNTNTGGKGNWFLEVTPDSGGDNFQDYSMVGRVFPAPVDISGLDTLTFTFRRDNSVDTYALLLYSDTAYIDGTHEPSAGDKQAINFIAPAQGSVWSTITIPLSSFNAIDLRTVNGWAILVRNKNTEPASVAARFFMDYIAATSD